MAYRPAEVQGPQVRPPLGRIRPVVPGLASRGPFLGLEATNSWPLCRLPVPVVASAGPSVVCLFGLSPTFEATISWPLVRLPEAHYYCFCGRWPKRPSTPSPSRQPCWSSRQITLHDYFFLLPAGAQIVPPTTPTFEAEGPPSAWTSTPMSGHESRAPEPENDQGRDPKRVSMSWRNSDHEDFSSPRSCSPTRLTRPASSRALTWRAATKGCRGECCQGLMSTQASFFDMRNLSALANTPGEPDINSGPMQCCIFLEASWGGSDLPIVRSDGGLLAQGSGESPGHLRGPCV